MIILLGMKTFVLAVALLTPTVPAQSPTFHVTSVRDWAPTDPAPASRAARTYVITGTIGGVKYTTEQLFTWGSQHFAVGADYPVTVAGQALKITMQDKKGHNIPERLDVVAVEETK